MTMGLERINLTPDEIVLSGSSVVVELSKGISQDLWKRAVGVRRAPATVSVSRDGKRLTWTPTEDAKPGWYEFSADGLVSKTGITGSARGRIRFALVRSSARVPANVAIESMARLRVAGWRVDRLPLFAERPRGRYVEMMKASDRRTGAPQTLAFDETGARVDPDGIMEGILRARVSRFGKLDEDLDRVLRQTPERKPVHVAIWASTGDDLDPTDKSPDQRLDDGALEQFKTRRSEVLRPATEQLFEEVRKLARQVEMDAAAPVVYARLTKQAIRRLEKSERVAAIFLYDPRGFDDLDDSIEIANSDDVHALGARGLGVRVAVWERGPDSVNDLDIEDRFETPGSMSSHSRLVHGIIKNVEPNQPHGHAPDCDLYSANSYDLAALRWAVVDENCTVINQSFHREEEQTSGSLSFDDVYKDWLVLRPPYPTIVQAAGNSGDDDEYVNHKGYNSLTAANHNDDASGLSGSSVFRNPDATHADRELPEISGNGTGVNAVNTGNSGTSFASPAVAGVAAILQGEEPVLRSWPEGCRALLLAGASRNITDSTWWQDISAGVDGADGSGAVNALESYRIVQARVGRNKAASRRGWDIGVLGDGDIGSNGFATFTYKVLVPSWRFGPRHVKVALAWNSKVKELSIFGMTIPLSSRLEQDLDLKIYDSGGALVAHAQSWDNSYEIAEFDARHGEEYTIRIRRYSGTGWTWYGIAWTVTGGIFDLIDIRDVVFEEEFADVLA